MAQQSYSWLPVQASTAAPLVDGLFSFETGIGTFVFGSVVSVMAWVLLKHRVCNQKPLMLFHLRLAIPILLC